MFLYKLVTRRIFHRNGLYRHKPNIIMDGINTKIKAMSMQTGCTGLCIGRMNIICRQLHYIVHGMFCLYLLAQDGIINKLRSNLPDCSFPIRYTSLTAFNARYRQGRITATGSLVYTNVTEHVKIGDVPADFQRLAPSFTVSLQPWQEQLLFCG